MHIVPTKPHLHCNCGIKDLQGYVDDVTLNILLVTHGCINLYFLEAAEYQPLKLYPEIPLNQNQNPNHLPTPEDIQQAFHVVDRTFFLLNTGQCVITDPLDRKSIIAIIEFTPWDNLTDKDKDNLNFFYKHSFMVPRSLSTQPLLILAPGEAICGLWAGGSLRTFSRLLDVILCR
ncbi:hypothetical protein VP01_3787g1 [Puccinia sorghi]|uniref:Uncharacterized protein n=1 Tax=Puccinia sorghi TaxID=27349 RepID=A0A0L6UUE6_9BASI|nr:hypothetical protein VP01_3787g1 [Puccinia sorghi]